jgi:hypothetical protein
LNFAVGLQSYCSIHYKLLLKQLQSAVIAGTLQCSSDEAIGLAGLQFRIEKMSERRNQTPDSLTANSPDSLLDGGGPCTTLQPISEDKEHHWPLDVPAVVTPSPVLQPQFNMFSAATVTSPTVTDEPSVGKIRNFFLRSCQYLCFGRRRQKDVQPVRDPFGILHKVHMYVPPDYRKPKNTAKLIKVSSEFPIRFINTNHCRWRCFCCC